MVGQTAWENGIDVNDGADGGDDAEEEDCASDLKKGKRQGTIQTAAAHQCSDQDSGTRRLSIIHW